MESLKKFQNKQIKGNFIFGGGWVNTSSTKTNEQGCTVTTEDRFNDTNGDGIWNSGETGSMCVGIECK
jgi:hypothetical protein